MQTCSKVFGRNRSTFRLAVLAALTTYSSPGIDLLVSNNNDNGPGSLRQAVLDNNTAGGGSTITFSNVVTGSITLTSGHLLITKPVTILGPGPKILAVNGNATSRGFYVSNTANVVISGLAITNGFVSGSYPNNLGGAIWNARSTLTLLNCVISGNRGGDGPGGAIYNDSTFGTAWCSFEYCTVSNNSTTNHGGAIYNNCYQGTGGMSFYASALIGNTALASDSVGGAVFNDGTSGNATIAFNSSTISGNTANQFGGGIYSGTGSGITYVALDYSTVCSNSAFSAGGIRQNGAGGSATLALRSTLLKTGTSGATIVNDLGNVVDYGFNMSSDNGGGVLIQPTDYINVNPLLGPLADNGGPTLTHALLPGSPAIDKGYNGVSGSELTPDQRGELRPFDFALIANTPGGNGTDIGAFEVGRPRLNLQYSGTNAVLLWPAFSAEFNLQTATNLTAPSNWITAGGAAVLVGDQYLQTNSPISNNRFFRLKQN